MIIHLYVLFAVVSDNFDPCIRRDGQLFLYDKENELTQRVCKFHFENIIFECIFITDEKIRQFLLNVKGVSTENALTYCCGHYVW